LNDLKETRSEELSCSFQYPPLVLARIIIEWACAPRGDRIQPDMHGWGSAMRASAPVIGHDQYVVATLNTGGRNVIRVTINRGYRGGPQSQENYEHELDAVANLFSEIQGRRL